MRAPAGLALMDQSIVLTCARFKQLGQGQLQVQPGLEHGCNLSIPALPAGGPAVCTLQVSMAAPSTQQYVQWTGVCMQVRRLSGAFSTLGNGLSSSKQEHSEKPRRGTALCEAPAMLSPRKHPAIEEGNTRGPEHGRELRLL